jgi:hypothetical protein
MVPPETELEGDAVAEAQREATHGVKARRGGRRAREEEERSWAIMGCLQAIGDAFITSSDG